MRSSMDTSRRQAFLKTPGWNTSPSAAMPFSISSIERPERVHAAGIFVRCMAIKRLARHIDRQLPWGMMSSRSTTSGIHLLREGEPQEKPALRIGVGNSIGKITIHGIDHAVLLLFIDPADFADVTVKFGRLKIGVHSVHGNGAALHVGRRAQRGQAGDNLPFRPTAQPRRRPGHSVLEKVPAKSRVPAYQSS